LDGSFVANAGGNIEVSGAVRFGPIDPFVHSGGGTLTLSPAVTAGSRLRLRHTGPGLLVLGAPQLRTDTHLSVDGGSGPIALRDGLQLRGTIETSGPITMEGTVEIVAPPGDRQTLRFGAGVSMQAASDTLLIGTMDTFPLNLEIGSTASGAGVAPGVLMTRGKILLEAFGAIATLFVSSGELDVASLPSANALIVRPGTAIRSGEAISILQRLESTDADISSVAFHFAPGTGATIASTSEFSALLTEQPLRILGSSIRVTETCEVVTANAGLIVPNTGEVTCGLITSQGRLELGSAARLTATSGLDLFGGNLVLNGSDHVISAGAEIRMPDGGGSYPSLTLELPGALSILEAPTPVSVGRISWPTPNVRTSFSGGWTFLGGMDFSNTSVLLNANTRMTFTGDVVFGLHDLSFAKNSVFTFTGSTTFTTRGSTLTIPQLVIGGNSLQSNGDLRVSGDVTLQAGLFDIGTNRLDVDGRLVVQNGVLRSDIGSTIHVQKDIDITSGTLDMPPASLLRAEQSVSFLQSGAPAARFMLSGSGTFDIPAGMQLRTLIVLGMYNLPSTASLLVSDSLSIDGRFSANAPITLTGNALHVGGILDGNGSLALETPATVITGSGSVANVSVSLPDPGSQVLVSNSSLHVTRRLIIRQGQLLVDGGLLFLGTPGSPLDLRLTMSGENATGDMRTAADGRINPESTPLNISVDGPVTGFPALGDLSKWGPINDLDLSTVDALNTPPVFGLSVSGSQEIAGELRVSADTRLLADSLTLTRPGALHSIEGQLSAASVLTVTSSATVGGSETGQLGNVVFRNSDSQLLDIARVTSLSVETASLMIGGRVPFTISERLLVTESDVRLDQEVQIGSGDGTATVRLSSATLTMLGNSSLETEGVFDVVVGPGSVWDVESPNESGGYMRLRAGGSIDAPGGIARLEIDAPESDILMEGAVRVTDRFISRRGTLRLSGNEMHLSGSSWNHTRLRITGTPSETSNSIHIEGSFQVELEGNLRLENASLTLLPGVDRLISFTRPHGTQYAVSIQNQQLSVINGTVDLGAVDINLQGTTPTVLTLDAAQIVSSLNLNTDPGETEQDLLFPFLDTDTGEVVFDSPVALSGVVARGGSGLQNVRIEQSTRLVPVSEPLTVSGRLVLGERGAQFDSSAPEQLVLSAGSTIVRRGSGVLTHPPLFEGPVRLAYDMDDGSVTGRDRAFGSGSLVTGLELAPVVESLAVLAGNRESRVHTLLLGRDVVVQEDVSIFSGVLSTANSQLTLQGGATLRLQGLDSDAPPGITGTQPWTSSGVVNLTLALPFATTALNNSIFPANIEIGAFRVDMGRSGGTAGPDLILHAPRTVQSLHIRAFEPASVFNLDGSRLSVRDSLLVESGTVSSNSIAELHSTGPVHVATPASVTGNVRLLSDTLLSLDGHLSNLSTEIAGRAIVKGTWSPVTSIVMTGAATTVEFFRSELAFNQLLVRSDDAATPFVIKGPDASSVRIAGGLTVERGVLSISGAKLHVPESAALNTSSSGWVESTVSRPVPAGFTGKLAFGIGSDIAYRPIDIEFDTPLLSGTILTAQLSDREPVLEAGLPVADIQDTGRFAWLISSTINFAGAQPFSIRIPDESSTDSTVGVLTRVPVSTFSRWTATQSPVSGGWEARGIRQGLDKNGLLVSTAEPLRNGPRAYIQMLTAWRSADLNSTRLVVDEEIVAVTPTGFSTTGVLPITAVPFGEVATVVAISNSNISDTIAETIISTTDEALSLVGIGTTGTVSLSAPIEKTVRWAAFNADANNPAVSISQLWPERAFLFASVRPLAFTASAPGADFSAPFSIDATGVEAVSFSPTTLPPLDFPSIIVLAEELSPVIMSPDGSTSEPAIVTHADADPELPSALRIHPIYPNPVRGTATIPVDVPAAAAVRITLVDMLGREVRRVNAGQLAAGRNLPIRVDASGLAAGTYLYVVEAAAAGQSWRETGTMTVLR